ncbi:uncharacterized protein LOC120539738 [Polypterus senegalus]|uniref:uncharacterized protein LOC120539738 n=1 Tax=Polypterus senegalus TaxID=55291 RepID=UPI001962CB62|nr:uncharacterized protein LOC120539738 [Polypterus senegalus]
MDCRTMNDFPDVSPEDSFSQISIQSKSHISSAANSAKASQISAKSKRSASSAGTSISVIRSQEAAHTVLLAKVENQRKQQALDMEEMQLKAKRKAEEMQRKAKRDQLELEAAFAETDAKLKALIAVPNRLSQKPDVKFEKSSDANSYNFTNTNESKNKSQQPFYQQQNEALLQQLHHEQRYDQQKQQQNKAQAPNVPHIKVPVFEGAPLTYINFIRAFDRIIDQEVSDPGNKLEYLVQFTKGEPRNIAQNSACLPSEEGYRNARRMLDTFYGNHIQIGDAYMKKIRKWPQLKSGDVDGLKAYTLFIGNCKSVMSDLKNGHEFENNLNIRIMLSKLPQELREIWQNKATKIESKERRPGLADLYRLLEERLIASLDPMYGASYPSYTFKREKEKTDHEKYPAKGGMRKGNFVSNVAATVEKGNKKETTERIHVILHINEEKDSEDKATSRNSWVMG